MLSKKKVEASAPHFDITEETVSSHSSTVTQLESKVHQLQEDNDFLKAKEDSLLNCSCCCNIWIFGVLNQTKQASKWCNLWTGCCWKLDSWWTLCLPKLLLVLLQRLMVRLLMMFRRDEKSLSMYMWFLIGSEAMTLSWASFAFPTPERKNTVKTVP